MLLEDHEEKLINIGDEKVYYVEMYWYLSKPAVTNLLNVAQVVACNLEARRSLCRINQKATLPQLPYQDTENISHYTDICYF